MGFKLESAVNRNAYLLDQDFNGGIHPHRITGCESELNACKETAWIGCALCLRTPTYDISGPDVIKFLNRVCVNRDYAKMPINGSRHGIMCNEDGLMLADGLIVRTGEDKFRTYFLATIFEYYVTTLGLDVKGEYITDDYFYQIDGPKSLEILEDACQCDLHDIKYARSKTVRICDSDMTIIRLGMSGGLAYEVHGSLKYADVVFGKLLESGAKFGAKQLGDISYCNNHTLAGIPNQTIHYWYPYFSSGEDLSEFVKPRTFTQTYLFSGSCADDSNNFFVTPYDVGWGNIVNFDHDFIGKIALEKIAKNPPNRPVTLVWNADDVADVFASQFRGKNAPRYDDLAFGGEFDIFPFIRASKVLKDGKMIGRAAGRIHDYYHREEISLAWINTQYAVEGDEVIVLWGNNGGPQKEIRAKIVKFPYYDGEYRNESFDVEKIPHHEF